MTDQQYQIFLDGRLIGLTALEKADVPMGIVFGEMKLNSIDNPYAFFKSYCLERQIGITDHKQDQFLSTRHIPTLKVIDSDGTEIKGDAISVAGQGSSDFEITIEGVPRNIYSYKFKHHIDHYKLLFDRHYENDNIIEIGIDEQERLFIKPESATFPFIYRTATEVHWDEKRKVLYSPKPKEWTYTDWYKQIVGVVQTECNHLLHVTDDTIWTNVPSDLKEEISEL